MFKLLFGGSIYSRFPELYISFTIINWALLIVFILHYERVTVIVNLRAMYLIKINPNIRTE